MNTENSSILGPKLGAILMIAGTSIGAGMLALPIATANTGPIYSFIIMMIVAFFSFYMALVASEVSDYLGDSLSVAKMANLCFGKYAATLSMIVLSTLFYSLICAYLSGMTSIIKNNFLHDETIADFNISTAIGIGVGIIIMSSTKVVDYSNRLFFSIKFLLLVILLLTLTPHISLSRVINNESNFDILNLSLIFPLFFTSFGFHGSIPAILRYIKKTNPNIFVIFAWGVTIPLILYSLWIFTISGTLASKGSHSLESISKAHDGLSSLFEAISHITGSNFIKYIVVGFGWCMITSLLGVSLGMFDFFMETFSYRKTKFGRLKASLWTFVPPIVLLIFKANIFVSALAFAAISLSFLAIIMPSLSAWYLMSKNNKIFRYSTKTLLVLSLIFSCLIIIAEIYNLICH